MRGQAFVVFKDIESSTKAIDISNGILFFNKNIEVTYARTKSKAFLQDQGRTSEAFAIDKTRNFKLNNKNIRDNTILLIEEIPLNYNDEQLKTIFSKFNGFIKFYFKKNHPGNGFCHFISKQYALKFMDKLQGLQLENRKLRITLYKH